MFPRKVGIRLQGCTLPQSTRLQSQVVDISCSLPPPTHTESGYFLQE
jgi:hypothetical protein